jgi:uncharacterized protein YbaR (Trm112 family)
MSLDSFLVDVLACPCPSHSPLRVRDAEVECEQCSTIFPVRNGIPVMLIDDAIPGPHGIGGVVGDER